MGTTGGAGVERELEAARGKIPTDTFAARLILARHHAGQLSQREAAGRCGLNYASWSNWENGMRPRDLLDVVEQIADGLSIDRNWLLFGGQLAAVQPRPLRRSATADLNTPLNQPARKDDPKPVRHVTTRPFGPPRRDPNHPPSPVPLSTRRPRDTRPVKRPMAVAS
jgi:transcriptional regulator with XRE-family HTH domain